MKLEPGKTYKINHLRKGNFVFKVTEQNDTWTHGIIIEGKTTCMLSYNDNYTGEEITIRSSLIVDADEEF